MIPVHPTNDVWYRQPSHWGGYDGSALLVWPTAADAGTTVTTDAALVRTEAGQTTILAGALMISTDAARIDLQAGTTSIVAGEVTVTTGAARIDLRAGTTTVAVARLIDTTAAIIDLRAGTTTVRIGPTVTLGPADCQTIAPTSTAGTVAAAASPSIVAASVYCETI